MAMLQSRSHDEQTNQLWVRRGGTIVSLATGQCLAAISGSVTVADCDLWFGGDRDVDLKWTLTPSQQLTTTNTQNHPNSCVDWHPGRSGLSLQRCNDGKNQRFVMEARKVRMKTILAEAEARQCSECPKLTCPEPACPKLTCPEPACPKLTCPEPDCPKSVPLGTMWPDLKTVAVHVALLIYFWTCNSGQKTPESTQEIRVLQDLLHEELNELRQQPGELVRVCEELKRELKQAHGNFAVVNGQETSVMQHKLDDLKHMMQAMFASDGAGTGDSSSICTFSSWTHVGSSRCCFLPETYLKVVTEDGDVPKLARRLVQGEAVRAANGEVMQVLHPPEQHEARAVVELGAGMAFLVVSPDHRILVPGKTTVQARELALGSDVILIDAPAKLSHFEWKLEPMLVLKISFKPDLPVAAFMEPPSILSKGCRNKPVLRRGLKKRLASHAEVLSIPDTTGYLSD
ncbi:unnamed protein product [Effrenium voratum]|uniref:Uncharacterized protein n=1 Tax=Effrenium voratum TaxID=2562239 RepID=A0AA36JS06_9DINO|nr:unnamed protein product [Effrenium voratum]CAJ1431471.1 unnamed protein product [Effrenium voratum]